MTKKIIKTAIAVTTAVLKLLLENIDQVKNDNKTLGKIYKNLKRLIEDV